MSPIDLVYTEKEQKKNANVLHVFALIFLKEQFIFKKVDG